MPGLSRSLRDVFYGRLRPGVREFVSGQQPDLASRERTQTVGLGVTVSGGNRLGSRPAIDLASTALVGQETLRAELSTWTA
ncbi:hypothetical protein VTN00DRAFT_1310 [Thermoascus crustaceus]|uniref:uncharacterized protein n=1 Tax=Thermoascus crustaceus TaxID=5088 RepID=UPI00374279FB